MKQAAILRAQYRYNQTQVIYLTQITPVEYHAFFQDMGKAWAMRYWQNTTPVECLLKTRLYWQWWAARWNDIDDQRFLTALYEVAPTQRYAAYREMHQYVFDHEYPMQQFLLKDFRALQQKFETEIKKPSRDE